jgi:hypothetical protein
MFVFPQTPSVSEFGAERARVLSQIAWSMDDLIELCASKIPFVFISSLEVLDLG